MSKMAICFDSWHGHTAEIADRIAQQVQALGWNCDIHAIRNKQPLATSGLDAIVLIAPVHIGKHSKNLRKFVQQHQQMLSRIPSLFFSVSLAAAGDPTEQRKAHTMMMDFLEDTEWKPTESHILAGQLSYQRYALPTRWIMRWIAWRQGGSTDTCRNHVYTDWKRLRHHVDAFVTSLTQSEVSGCPSTERPDSYVQVAS